MSGAYVVAIGASVLLMESIPPAAWASPSTTSQLEGQWIPDGVPICTAPGPQREPLVLADGAGGCYIGWIDRRNGNDDVYVQRVLSSGVVAAGWPADGLALSDAPSDQKGLRMVSDASGGIYAGWITGGEGGGVVYVARVLSNGEFVFGSPAAPRAVPASDIQRHASLAPDGAGGVYVSWNQSYDPNGILLQHLLPTGETAVGWPPLGLLAGGGDSYHGYGAHLMLADGMGGVWMTFSWNFYYCYPGHQCLSDQGTTVAHYNASRTLVHATNLPPWLLHSFLDVPKFVVADPVSVISVYGPVHVHRLSWGGANWELDLGDPAMGPWIPNGSRTKVALPDGTSGGAYFLWNNTHGTWGAAPMLCRVASNGAAAPGWTLLGVPATNMVGTQYALGIIPDGRDGVFLCFIHEITWQSQIDLYMNRFDGQGAVAPEGRPEGVPLCLAAGVQDQVDVCADGSGAVVAAWRDGRGVESDIYAQRIILDAPVPVTLAAANAVVSRDAVTLTWQAIVRSIEDAVVERAANGTTWTQIGFATVRSRDAYTFEDRDVRPGERLGYRLRLGAAAANAVSPETWVDIPGVPTTSLSIHPGAEPGTLAAHVALAGLRSARLDWYDLSGRRLGALDLGHLGGGEHVVGVTTSGVTSGLIVIRLTDGPEQATAKAVVFR
jgi:hypothetical protein